VKPREWVGCVVGVRAHAAAGFVGTHTGCVTIRRAWRRKRDGALTRVEFTRGGDARERRQVVGVERVAEGPLAGLRVLVLGAEVTACNCGAATGEGHALRCARVWGDARIAGETR
jgi:hypothetical protein